MPALAQSRVSAPAPDVQPTQSPTPGLRSLLGNAGLVERLLGTGNQLKSNLPRSGENFPHATGSGGTPLELLAGTAEIAPAPEAGDQTAGPQTGGQTGDQAGQQTGGQTGPQTGDQTAVSTKVAPKAGTMAAGVYDKHTKQTDGRTSKLTASQLEDLELFVANWKKNKGRYEAVAAKTNIPAPLIAALHWRESTGSFKTYLHQGDPLGKPAVNVPSNIPVFHVWEEAAVHALTMSDKKQVRDDLNMTKDTKDTASMATYAEFYNGLGYHNKDRASPYVYSGTDNYSKGKYVSDGHYSKNTVDQQLGVMSMLSAIDGSDKKLKNAPVVGLTGWESVKAGRSLKRGMRGPLVKELQTRLAKAGFACGDDSSFGPTVEKAVKAFQKANALTEDGIVGKDVAAKLDTTAAPDPAKAADPPKPQVGPQ